MGYDLMTNFRRPYLAANIQDFWRRWHISLSTWFRDYVYIPLGVITSYSIHYTKLYDVRQYRIHRAIGRVAYP